MKFEEDFFYFFGKLKRNESFAYTRFSDGEICVMQNKELKLADDHVVMGETRYGFGYSADDHKHYDPNEHGFLKDILIEAYKYKKENYFVGGICKDCTCASREFAPWMHELYGQIDDKLTSANLLVNSNYPLFVGHFIPELKKKKLVFICSENADLDNSEFNVVKDFRVGKNCIVIEGHVFLLSASSLSEVLIYELFKHNDKNTYIDIGTTLHPYIGLRIERDDLRAYHKGLPHPDLYSSCV